MCLCETKCQGGGYRTILGRAQTCPEKVSRDMGYRSDSIAVSRDMGPLSLRVRSNSLKRFLGHCGRQEMGRQMWRAQIYYFACSPEEFFEFSFLSVCVAWEFCIEKWRGFLVKHFSGLRLPRKEATKSPRKIRGEIRSKIRGKIRDENSKNSGNFRSATFLT